MILTLLANIAPFALLVITWMASRNTGEDSAIREAKEVHTNNMAGKYDDLDHDALTKERLVLLLLCTISLCLTAIISGVISWWLVPCLLALCWAGFVTKHRWTINRELKKRETYMSPGNRYDWFWIKRAGATIHSRDVAKSQHRFWYNGDLAYAYAIHRAGRHAFIFEYTVAVVSAVLGIINSVLQWEPLRNF